MHSKRRLILVTLIAWFSMLGFDFLLHAGVLAQLYEAPSSFLRPPMEAFALIPVGYVSFLLFAILLTWLMKRLNVVGWRAGAVFGAQLGALVWGALALGLFSVSTASASLLIGWLIGQTLELALAGAVVGSGLAGARLGRLFGVVLALVVLSAVAAIVLQTLGVAPSQRVS